MAGSVRLETRPGAPGYTHARHGPLRLETVSGGRWGYWGGEGGIRGGGGGLSERAYGLSRVHLEEGGREGGGG